MEIANRDGLLAGEVTGMDKRKNFESGMKKESQDEAKEILRAVWG